MVNSAFLPAFEVLDGLGSHAVSSTRLYRWKLERWLVC